MQEDLFAVERGNAAKFARPELLAHDNDIDFYIEDTAIGFKKLYVNLLERYFPDKKIVDVHPLGSRSVVINTCDEKLKNNQITRPSLFIVDGDLYLLKGENELPKHLNQLPKGVFRLPVYSIENLVLDKDAIIEYINEDEKVKLRPQVIEDLDITGWTKTNKDYLVSLFIHYALIQKLKIKGFKTISYKVKDLAGKNSPYVDKVLIEKRINDCKKAILIELSEDEYDNEVAKIKSNLTTNYCQLFTHVAGKDYLFPLLQHQMKKVSGKSYDYLNLVQRLATKCSLDLLKGCENHIVDINH